MAKTRIIKIDPLSPDEGLLKEVSAVIKKGGLVILPTETVYGIACGAFNKEALKRLSEIKQRPADKPFSLLLDYKDKIEELARGIPVAAYKLTDKFWPGPLTLILKSRTEGTVGVRMPDYGVTLKVIGFSGVPLACPSANISGKSAPKTFVQALGDFDGLVELAVDAGDALLGQESSVVDLTVEPLQVLREAALTEAQIRSVATKKIILFVCTGNSCRSVMAEALLKRKLQEAKRTDVEVLSAGIMMVEGLTATDSTKLVLANKGIDVSLHRSHKLSKQLIKKADFILVMERLQEQRLLELAPEVKNRVFLLKEFAKIDDRNLDIEDPVGKPLAFYEKTLEIINDAIERIIKLI